jgi:hypothetical protein
MGQDGLGLREDRGGESDGDDRDMIPGDFSTSLATLWRWFGVMLVGFLSG